MATVHVPLNDNTSFAAHFLNGDAADAGMPLPAVILIHDILGFNADTARIAKQLHDGPIPMHVIAPDLYQGLGPKPLCVVKTIGALRRKQGVTFKRLQAVYDWLGNQPTVDTQRIGVVGFCIGGGFALLFAASTPVAVVAPFYGDVPQDAHDLKGICPVVTGYGARDRVFAPQGRRLKSHLETLGVVHDWKEYPHVGHSYMNQLTGLSKLGRYTPMAAAYDDPAAQDSWQRLFDFFEQHL